MGAPAGTVEGYVLDVGEYRYDVDHGPELVTARCVHVGSGVTAEASAELQHDARMAARARVDEIRQEGRL